MSITIKPKQALGFLPARNCICDSPYCQPILTTDSTMLQGTVSEATGTNRLLNGEFTSSTDWTLGAGFSIAGGKLVATNISGTTAFSGALGLTVGKLYLVQTSVTVTSAGSATAGQGWYAQINGNSLQLPNSIPLGDGFNESLTASWIYSPSAISSDNFLFTTDETTIDFTVEYVRVYELSMLGMAVYRDSTLEDNITTFSGSNFLKYYFNGTLFMTNGALIGGVTNVLYESVTSVTSMFELYIDTWASVTDEEGCLTVRFYDTVFLTNRLRNGGFGTGNLDWWTYAVGEGWVYSAGQACFSSVGAFRSLSQSVILLGGSVYYLDGSFNPTPSNMVITYTVDGGSPITSTYDSLYTIDLTAYSGNVTVVIYITPADLITGICVDNLTIYTLTPDSENVTNCINIQTSHPCTLYFYAVNTDNAFGLNYTTGSLQHFLRVYGKIKYSDYPEESELFKFSDNSYRLMQASSEKEFEVIIGDAPEQIHDCIAILRLHDTFTIDGDSYVASGKYELNRRRTSDNSQAVFTVKEQTGVSSNYSCL